MCVFFIGVCNGHDNCGKESLETATACKKFEAAVKA